MDPYCTTSMLGYPQHSVDQQNGIGRKDHTTLWDWLEFPKGRGFGLKFYPVKQIGSRWPLYGRGRKHFTNQIIPLAKDAVPHNGIKSENQAAYVVPVPITVCFIFNSNTLGRIHKNKQKNFKLICIIISIGYNHFAWQNQYLLLVKSMVFSF